MVTSSTRYNNRRHIDNINNIKYGNSSDYKMIVTRENVPMNF
jgi:hypothetical protein